MTKVTTAADNAGIEDLKNFRVQGVQIPTCLENFTECLGCALWDSKAQTRQERRALGH